MATRIDMIGIFPADMEKTIHFYRDVLGFAVEWDGNSPYAEAKNSGVRFSFYSRQMLGELLGQEPGYINTINGHFEIAIDLPRFADVDREFERVVGLGAKPIYGPRDEPWGMRSSMVADPDGNLIEIGSWNKGE